MKYTYSIYLSNYKHGIPIKIVYTSNSGSFLHIAQVNLFRHSPALNVDKTYLIAPSVNDEDPENSLCQSFILLEKTATNISGHIDYTIVDSCYIEREYNDQLHSNGGSSGSSSAGGSSDFGSAPCKCKCGCKA